MIKILPLASVDGRIVEDLKEDVGNTFLASVDTGEPIVSLPEDIIDKGRGQYDASRLVEFLLPYLDSIGGDKFLAVCDLDLFVEDMNYIFGIAQKGRQLCIISLRRLDPAFYGKRSNYGKTKERAIKEAIHELGHCYGMDHCGNERCVMSFSNHIDAVDRKEKFFCEKCREKLKDRL